MKHSENNNIKSGFRSTGLSDMSVIWWLIAMLVPNMWLIAADGQSLPTGIASEFMAGGIYALLLSLSRKPWKPMAWLFPVTFLAAFQIVLLNLYGHGVIAVDMFLNLVTTNSSEVTELLMGLLPALMEVAVLYIVPLVMAIVAGFRKGCMSKPLHRNLRRYGLIALIAGSVLSICGECGLWRFRFLDDVFPASAVNNCVIAAQRWQRMNHYKETSASFRYGSQSSRGQEERETYVVVIGESSRASNWSLAGYERETNPLLKDTEGLFFFRNAMSESNTTHKSVPLMMSGLRADNYDDSIHLVKSFIAAFREAGFHTAFITAQQPNHSYIDFFADEADSHIFLPQAGDRAGDMHLLSYLDEELGREDRKKLIVLHTYGSHYNYQDRYPEENAVFLPDSPLESSAVCRERLVNAYDNTILQTDRLLYEVISRLENKEGISAMFYTSDHGENIFDDERELFLHSSPKTSFYQQEVPFIVWLSKDYRDSIPSKGELLNRNIDDHVSSSSSFFHTLLDIGGISTSRLNPSLSLADSAYTFPGRVFLDDHNKAVPLREAMDDPIDLSLLDEFEKNK